VILENCLIFIVDFVFVIPTNWMVICALIIHLVGLGFLGVCFNQNHLVTLLMFMELIMISLAFSFTEVAVMFGGLEGFVLTFLLLVIAGVESALVLSLVTNYFFVENKIYIDQISKLKG